MLRFRPPPAPLAIGAIALCAAAAFAAPSPATAAARGSAPNLLVNPGFEEPLAGHLWMPAGWDTTVSGLPSVFFGRDTLLSHDRGHAVSVANVSTLLPMSHAWVQALLIPPAWWGKDAVFSVWTRSNGLVGRAFMRAIAYNDTINKMAKVWGVSHEVAADRLNLRGINDPQDELGWKVGYFSEEETDWVRREVRVPIAPSTNLLQVSIGVFGTGQVLFDDASLALERRRADPPAPLQTNLIADPGFEGSGNEWEYSMPPYEGFRIVRDSTVAHSGRAAIRYEGGLVGPIKMNAGACQSFTGRHLAGKHLRLSAWVKTDSLQGEAFVMLYCKTPRGTKNPTPRDRVWSTTDWKLTSLEFDSPPDTWEVWAWVLSVSPAPGRVWYDDVRLEVLGPARAPATRRGASRKP